MEQMTSICDMAGQIMQKKEEEKRITEEQAAKDRYWKIPICYDDNKDYTIAITPVLSTKEPVDSLIMEYEHLDTIPATELDEVIKSSVKNLVQVPSESKGISDGGCDDIDYVDASPPDAEIVSLEVVESVILEVGGVDTDILLTIKDEILREKLLNVNLLIAKIDALKDNPIPSSDFISSGSTTTHAYFSQYDSFIFDLSINQFPPTEPDQGGLISIVISDNSNDPLLELPEFESFHFDPSFPRPPPEPPDVEICLHFEPDAPVIDNFNELNDDQRGSEIDFSQNVEDDDSFTFVIRTFLPFLTYPVDSPLLLSTGSEDTIFDPGIST
ncbi:hypothetical protein Tco_1185802 [Tanacetum coccineum]